MEKQTTFVKSDTTENWNKAKNFIPKDKELIIYTDAFPNNLKIGDGITKVNDLPFIEESDYYVEDDTLVINTKGGN